MMAVAFGWTNYQNNTFNAAAATTNVGSTNAITTNGAFTIGDLLIATLIFPSTPGVITPPANWTQIGTTQIGSNSAAHAWFWKIAQAGETGSYTFNWVNSIFNVWGLLDYTGNPVIDVASVGTGDAGAGGVATASSVSPVGTADILVTIFAQSAAGTLFSGIPGNTRANVLQDASSFTLCELDQQLSASGPTGPVNANFGASQIFGWANIAIQSSVSVTPPGSPMYWV